MHVATPTRFEQDDTVPAEEWIEGEPGDTGPEPTQLAPVPCLLFLPQAPETAGGEVAWKPRVITRPTLLYNPSRPDGTDVGLKKDDELLIDAPDLAPWVGQNPARWQLDGIPQPAGPPGRPVVVIATLKRIED